MHHLSFSSLLDLQNSLIKEELDHNLDWRLLALFLVVQINIVNGLGCLSVPSSIILCVGDLFGIEISNNNIHPILPLCELSVVAENRVLEGTIV